MKTKSEVIKLMKEGYKIFVDCEDETGILYSIFKENGLYNPFKIEKGMCYYLTKSLPVNIRVAEFKNDYRKINLSEIEPDNEKSKQMKSIESRALKVLRKYENRPIGYNEDEIVHAMIDFLIRETIISKDEKPYLFYKGEKYYFGEEYEFSDDKKEWNKLVFELYNHSYNHPFGFNHIRKIDHTVKYKKQLEELKQQAEKDGVNLKELL